MEGRLVVNGKDGNSVEDRVSVEVGRVISQVLPGEAISTDNKVTMHFEGAVSGGHNSDSPAVIKHRDRSTVATSVFGPNPATA
jgi:hypothetical protein